MSAQRTGGIAGIALGLAIVIELAMFLVYAPSLGVNLGDLGTPTKLLDLLIRGRTGFSYSGLGFAAASLFALTLVRALDQRLRRDVPDVSATAAWFGYAAFVLLAVDFQTRAAFAHMSTDEIPRDVAMQVGPAVLIVQRAFTETFALAGAAYFVLLSVAVLRVGVLPRALGWLGLLVAAATIVEIFAAVDPAPQLLLMVWSFWTGAVLLTQPAEGWATTAARPAAAG
jgi:hypothetical protein